MELWIRSQNKLKLLKVNNLSICYGEKWYNEDSLLRNKWENSYEIQNNDICVGIYQTKERALEVLDEIQKHIINLGETVLNYGKEYYTYERVYEMPKE